MTPTPLTLDDFKAEVAQREKRVKAYLLEDQAVTLGHPHLNDAVYSYLKAGGKSLRPAVLLFAAGAVGGDESRALPAAAAVELYHTFSLVHDDIIDRDALRRGVPTVHVQAADWGRAQMQLSDADAAHYGTSVAILAGDVQQGWAAALMTELHRSHGVDAGLALNLIDQLFRRVMGLLVSGEALDVVLAETPVEQVTDAQIIDMLWQKTGVLYEFAGMAGAAIGLDSADLTQETVAAMAAFTGGCGIAFQLQDDILGVVGDESQMGKAVGNDIREGKRTLVLMGALRNMTAEERAFTLATVGRPDASDADLRAVSDLLKARGGVAHARQTAQGYVRDALTRLDGLPESRYKALLRAWADYILTREF